MSINKPKFTAIIMAAGSGTRMRSDTKKQFMQINGIPIVAYSIKAFQENDNIDSIVVVIPKGFANDTLSMCIRYGFSKVKNITEGSDKRFKSVYNGLLSAPEDTDYVLIHDGVRPMISQKLIDRCCKYVLMTRACVAAVPVTDTIKRANERALQLRLWTVRRSGAYRHLSPSPIRCCLRHTNRSTRPLRITARMKTR